MSEQPGADDAPIDVDRLGDGLQVDAIERQAVLRRVASRLFDAAPRAPVRIDRYEILELIGAGGMGHVYAARDPQLDRTVALKLLPPGFVDDDRESARLRHEARTLARLAHPNIVHVYELGRAGERSFVAMEYVDGPTLREFQRSADADWRTILALYLDAARGLIAAHEAGVVHRDFKPANILLSRGMRVRVADFGIARVSREGDTTARTTGPRGDVGDERTSTARAGSSATAGTPAYMSPEQRAGASVGPASDQFSFCVALFEGIYGAHPFAELGESVESVVDASALRRRAGRGRGPRILLPILSRGLARDPARRFPSMKALVDAIEARLRRRRLGFVSLPILLILSLAAVGAYMRQPSCAGFASALDGVWDARARDKIERAFTRTELPFASALQSSVVGALDERGDRWVEERTALCLSRDASPPRGAVDPRIECLEDQRARLGELAEALAGLGAEDLVHAHDLVTLLPSSARCRHPSGARAGDSPLPAKAYPILRSLKRRLFDARVEGKKGNYTGARKQLATVLADAQAGGFASLIAETSLAAARVDRRLRDYPAAEAQLLRGFEALGTIEDNETQFDVLLELGLLKAVDLEQRDAAALVANISGASGALLSTRPELRARLFNLRGQIAELAAEFEVAEAMYKRALAELESIDARDGLAYADSLSLLANAIAVGADVARAPPIYREARKIRVAHLGEGHPRVNDLDFNLALALTDLKRTREARELLERVLARDVETYGDDSRNATEARLGLAGVEFADGEYNTAIALLKRARATALRATPQRRSTLLTANQLLVNAYIRTQRYEPALERARESLATLVSDPPGPELTRAHINVAEFLCLLERCGSEAREHFNQALQLIEEAEDDESLALMPLALSGLAKVALSRDAVTPADYQHALPLLERALLMAERLPASPEFDALRAEVAFLLARALHGVGLQPARSLALARASLEHYTRVAEPQGYDEIVDFINALEAE